MHGSDGFDALGFSGTPGLDALARHGDVRALDAALHGVLRVPARLGRRGAWRGGLGTTSSWRFYGEGELGVTIGDDAASEGADPRAGLFGGEPAGLNELRAALPGRHDAQTGARRRSCSTSPSGTICVARNGGGGGYGDPHERRGRDGARRGARRAVSVEKARAQLRRRRAARPARHRRGRDGAPARAARVSYRVGIDVGGTFTDFLVIGPTAGGSCTRRARRPPTRRSACSPGSREIAALSSAATWRRSGRDRGDRARHDGDDERRADRRGARTGLLATKGFRDALALRDGLREEPYDNRLQPPAPLVPRYLRAGHRGAHRLGGRGGRAALRGRRPRGLRDLPRRRASRRSRSRSCTRRRTRRTSGARATSAASCCPTAYVTALERPPAPGALLRPDLDDGAQRLRRADHHALPRARSTDAARRARLRRRAADHAVERRRGDAGRGRRARRALAALGPGVGPDRRALAARAARRPRLHHDRHGRHELRRGAREGRRAARHDRRRGRPLADRAADDRHPHDRRRRRLDRAGRAGGLLQVGPQSAGAEPGPGLLRPRRDASRR